MARGDLSNRKWQKVLQSLQARAEAQDQLDWQTASADSSVIRAHQHAAGASRQSSPSASEVAVEPTKPLKEQIQAVQALGYSRGGFSTKVHLVCDGKGRPLAAKLSPGQAHDSQYLAASLEAVRVPRLGRGRPKKRPH